MTLQFGRHAPVILWSKLPPPPPGCPRPLKSLIKQETLSPKLLTKLKEQRYSYCVISRYFTLRHLGRLLTPFITKFYFRATAFMQQRSEVTSEFRLSVVGRAASVSRKAYFQSVEFSERAEILLFEGENVALRLKR